MSHLMPPINRIPPHYEYKKIEENDKVTSPWFYIGIKMVAQVVLGYIYLSVMRLFQVNNIVTATLIYPIVLINYAGMEVIVALFRDANSEFAPLGVGITTDPDADAHPIHIKFMLMMLSAQILLLSLVVWDDLYFIKP